LASSQFIRKWQNHFYEFVDRAAIGPIPGWAACTQESHQRSRHGLITLLDGPEPGTRSIPSMGRPDGSFKITGWTLLKAGQSV
jgi:hypothetical protein